MIIALLLALQAEPKFEDKTIEYKGGTVKYQVCVPAGYEAAKPMPLILFLHGSGEQGDDGQKQSSVGIGPAIRKNPQGWAPFLTLLPQKPRARGGFMEYEDLILAQLEKTKKEYKIDEARIYLTGLSMGGMGSWLLAGKHPQLWAAVAPVCGAGNPADAPKIKIANTKALGAEVRLYDRYREDREAIARSIAEERGFVLVPPYDDPAIIAGQGTIGLEIADDFAAMGEAPDVVVVPCSGGGLSSGIALAITTRFPEARVFACEPARFDDTGRSLAAGKRLSNPPDQKSICDALLSSTPGEITWPILKDRLTGALTATDEEALAAVSFAARRMKLVVEPGGAVALACALQGRTPKPARNIVIVCSGGNIDDEMLQKAMSIGD